MLATQVRRKPLRKARRGSGQGGRDHPGSQRVKRGAAEMVSGEEKNGPGPTPLMLKRESPQGSVLLPGPHGGSSIFRWRRVNEKCAQGSAKPIRAARGARSNFFSAGPFLGRTESNVERPRW